MENDTNLFLSKVMATIISSSIWNDPNKFYTPVDIYSYLKTASSFSFSLSDIKRAFQSEFIRKPISRQENNEFRYGYYYRCSMGGAEMLKSLGSRFTGSRLLLYYLVEVHLILIYIVDNHANDVLIEAIAANLVECGNFLKLSQLELTLTLIQTCHWGI